MRRSPGSDLQRAIAFLANLDTAETRQAALPALPDYECLARRASELGHELSPGAIREAFRLMMRARLVALSRPSPTDGGDR